VRRLARAIDAVKPHEPDAERADQHVDRRLRAAAPVVREIGGSMLWREFRFGRLERLDGVDGSGEPTHGRVRIDVAHRDMRRRPELTDFRAKARHKQRMRAVFLEEVAVDGDLFEPKRFR